MNTRKHHHFVRNLKCRRIYKAFLTQLVDVSNPFPMGYPPDAFCRAYAIFNFWSRLDILCSVSLERLSFCCILFTQSSMEHMNELEQKCDDQQPQHLKITKNTISVRSLDIPEQYSVGATSLDCSVMLTFKRLENSQQRYNNLGYIYLITILMVMPLANNIFELLCASSHNNNNGPCN